MEQWLLKNTSFNKRTKIKPRPWKIHPWGDSGYLSALGFSSQAVFSTHSGPRHVLSTPTPTPYIAVQQ